MNICKLQLIPSSHAPEFFDDTPTKTLCKIYHDGGHYIAVPMRNARPRRYDIRPENKPRELFDGLYRYATANGYKPPEKRAFLRDNLCHLFDDEKTLDRFLSDEIKRTIHNEYVRRKRFRRKAYLNKWTHFCTWTYSDAFMGEQTFRRKLRKCLCNLHSRHGWRYMGVFERAPETGRLHFHALVYIPDGETVGKIARKAEYSTRTHTMKTTHENDFFAKRFGRNDFAPIGKNDTARTVRYILKYLQKTGERITYSRNIPETVCKEIPANDFLAPLFDYVQKYVLSDNYLDWETDIAHFHPEQITLNCCRLRR